MFEEIKPSSDFYYLAPFWQLRQKFLYISVFGKFWFSKWRFFSFKLLYLEGITWIQQYLIGFPFHWIGIGLHTYSAFKSPSRVLDDVEIWGPDWLFQQDNYLLICDKKYCYIGTWLYPKGWHQNRAIGGQAATDHNAASPIPSSGHNIGEKKNIPGQHTTHKTHIRYSEYL